MNWKPLALCALTTVIFIILGWNRHPPIETNQKSQSRPHKSPTHNGSPPFSGQAPPHPDLNHTSPSAIANQRLVSFSSEQALNKFLNSINNHPSIKLLGKGRLGHTANLAYSDLNALSELLPEDAEAYENYPVHPPILLRESINPDAEGMNGRMKEWMGISEDNSAWGEGIKVAIIDTGVTDHAVFSDGITAYSLIESPRGSETHPHGTAMASLWRDSDGRIPAIAPAVDLSSIQVADHTGLSNSFLLAEGINLAVAEGVDIVTISMSSPNTNPYLDQAIANAKENGTLIVASAGNEGAYLEVFPASNPDVISVGAIGYNLEHTGFSNRSAMVDLVAPGRSIYAAGPEDTYIASTGTSPAAQISGATIAAFMSEGGYSDPYKASEIYLEHLNDLGAQGRDDYYGQGYPQMDVLLNHQVSGRYDAAIAGHVINTQDPSAPYLQVVVDNPGTEGLSDATLHLTAEGKSYEIPMPYIYAGESHLFQLPVPLSNNKTIQVNSRIELENGLHDVRPKDNARESQITLSD